MKKAFLFLLASAFGGSAFSQNVGLGTINPLNKLHVAGGFRLDTLANAWLLNGNSGIDPATQFLGTTDAQPLLFRVNNQPAGLIHPGYPYNTAFGLDALSSNTIGYDNTATGTLALHYNTSGKFNTANGRGALHSNTGGSDNTATGTHALFFNTTGYENTANGMHALGLNTTGAKNTAIGYLALYGNAASWFNVAVGYTAGYPHTGGGNNTFIGAASGVNGERYFNCIALGKSTTCTASNQMRVGNTSTSSIGGQVGWTTLSDERMKTNVQENVRGLDFIKMLRPVTYNLDVNKLSGWLSEDRHADENKISDPVTDELMRKSRNEKSKMVFSGFLAQDVEMAARQMGYDFSGVDAPKNENDLYGLRYADFVVPLVKAVQEQQQMIDELKKQNTDLQKRVTNLEKSGNNYSSSYNTTDALSIWPNPLHDKIFINIVADSKSQALIKIYDGKGALVKQQQAMILQGSNQVSLDMKGLAGGTYQVSAEWNSGQRKKTAQVVKQ